MLGRRVVVLSVAAFACGCASVPVRRVLVGGDSYRTLGRTPHAEVVDSCVPSRRVRVVDASGTPIQAARVIARQRVSQTASEETLAVYVYSAAPVRTDARGIAAVCEPGALLPRSPWHGIGGGGSFGDDGTILVTAGVEAVVLRPPFAGDLRAVFPPRP